MAEGLAQDLQDQLNVTDSDTEVTGKYSLPAERFCHKNEENCPLTVSWFEIK